MESVKNLENIKKIQDFPPEKMIILSVRDKAFIAGLFSNVLNTTKFEFKFGDTIKVKIQMFIKI